MPDVSSAAPAEVRTWVAIDQHKLSLVSATLPASGGEPEVTRLENTERSAASSRVSVAQMAWRWRMRQAQVGTSFTGCLARSAWRAT